MGRTDAARAQRHREKRARWLEGLEARVQELERQVAELRGVPAPPEELPKLDNVPETIAQKRARFWGRAG